MQIPLNIVQGDQLSWYDPSARDGAGNFYGAPDWTLQYSLRGPVVLDLLAQPNGNGWTTTLTSAQSLTLTPGAYAYQAYVSSGSARLTIGSGTVNVLPNLAGAAAGFDGRTQAQQDLDAVQAAMRAMISGGGVQRYTIGNRSVDKMQMADLIVLESRLKYRVAVEQRQQSLANGGGDPLKFLVRF